MRKSIFNLAAENEVVPSSNPETELTFYAKITDFEGLKQCLTHEHQEQVRVKTVNKYTGKKGSVRVRKTLKPDGTINFVLTTKVEIPDDKDDGVYSSMETNTVILEEQYNAFKSICSEVMAKDRYYFKTSSVTFKDASSDLVIEVPSLGFEVDVFKRSNSEEYSQWCKIDLELDTLNKVLAENELTNKPFNLKVNIDKLPFKPVNIFTSATANEEQKAMLDGLYRNTFSKQNR
jgi:hypothetical protein